MKLVTSEQMRAIETAAFAAGDTPEALMEVAGRQVARALAQRLGGAVAKRILVLVGPGNNGGDGLVAARYLHQEGADIQVVILAPRPDDDVNLKAAADLGVDIVAVDESSAASTITEDLLRCDAVIDAVLGIGTHRPLTGAIAAAFDAVKAHRPPVFAVDVPSGLDADTGAVDACSLGADVTFALGFSKLGLHLLPGSTFAGAVEVLDIGLAASAGDQVLLEVMTEAWAMSALPERPLVSNKGTFGRVLVIAGSESYTGAAALSCLGALRAGAGLVSLACIPAVRAAVAAQLPEVTFRVLAEVDGGLAPDAAQQLATGLDVYDVVLIGPGLGQSDGVRRTVRTLLSFEGLAGKPVVVDADGLNALAHDPYWHETAVCDAVLTPHPGEFGRLTHASVRDVQLDRIRVARETASRWRQTVVLKGAETVIAASNGSAKLSPFANPALATAGTGDVLAGAIAGLMAQGTMPYEAAALGVYLHGAAAELYSDDYGNGGLLASELGAGIARAAAGLRRELDGG